MAPLSLTLYRAATQALGPLAGPMLRARVRRGKEDPDRLAERFARATPRRPADELIWIHAASVGESLMMLPLLDALLAERPGWGAVVTTNTRTSARLLAERLPARAVHQYAPIDRADVAKRFLAWWRPRLGVFAESEVWPNLILAAEAAEAPLALVNARMTEKSLKGWSRAPGAAKRVFGAFASISAADQRTADGLSSLLNRTVPLAGNLKHAVAAPPADAETLARLRAIFGERPVWLAASTHPGEEQIALEAHRLLRAQGQDWLLLLVPRHPERGPDAAALAEEAGFPSLRRAAGAEPEAWASVYVADTLGELGLWFRLCRAALIGGSLVPDIGGHNPFEPALLDAPIITGPFTHNFEDLFAELIAVGGAALAETPDQIAAEVAALTPSVRETRVAAAAAVARHGDSVLEKVMMGLRPLLPEAADARA